MSNDSMTKIKISEIPSGIWNFSNYFNLPIDRSNTTVAEFLKRQNVIWTFGDDPNADFRVYKEENIRNGLLSLRRFRNEYEKRFETIPYLNLNGEAQENSRIAYMLADPARTFSVAPGNKFKRLYFPSVWSDPLIRGWPERLDRICWIGRPLPERIRLAKKISRAGIGLDIFSKDPWPMPEWRGYIKDEIEISQRYKYRIIYENSLMDQFHTEKLFNSIRSGCVTFYVADPDLILPHLEGAYIQYSDENFGGREDLSQGVLDTINEVMFTDRWMVYSFKNFFSTIIDFLINSAYIN
jgi:hypothetical protein